MTRRLARRSWPESGSSEAASAGQRPALRSSLRIGPALPARSVGTSVDAASVLASRIPQLADQIGHCLRRGRVGGRPPGFVAETYKERDAVERCTARRMQWRGLAMPTAKLAIAYQAALYLAAILTWTRR